MSVEASEVLSSELYSFSNAISGGGLNQEYLENGYDGSLEDFDDCLELERIFTEAMAEVDGAIAGYDGFETPEEVYVFLAIEPGINQGELADRLGTSSATVGKMISGMEERELLETTGKRRGKKYFYGPKAFPYLQLAAELEEHIDYEEARNKDISRNGSGFEIPEDADNREILELGQELLDESADMEFKGEDDGIEGRDFTDAEEVEVSVEEPEEDGGPDWF